MSLEDFNIYYINNWILIPAACIILFLSFLERRSHRSDVCGGRFALIIPLPFLNGFENRLAYAVALGTISNRFVSLVISQRTDNIDFPLWAKALDLYLEAIIGCLTCFPILACLSTRYRAIGAGICILYSAVWLSISVVYIVKKANDSFNETVWDITVNDDVTETLNKSTLLLLGLPNLVSYVLLITHCLYIIVRCVRTKNYYNYHTDRSLRPHQVEHVRWVFGKSKKTSDYQELLKTEHTTFIQRMNKEILFRLFKNLKFFKYPTKILAMAFLQIVVVYWIATFLILSTIKIVYEIFMLFKGLGVEKDFSDQIIIIAVCGSVSLIIAVVNAVVSIFVSIRNYRHHLLKIYQGEKEFAVKFQESSQILLTNSMVYPGYQVGFIMWGCVISYVFILLVLTILVEIIYFLATMGMLESSLLNFLQILSFPVITLIFFYIQVVISKKVLLQKKLNETDEDPPLNIDNRKLFELMNYYSLFINMAVGVFQCLMRILLSAFYGVFIVGRLDKSALTNDIETLDKGYKSYLSMLLLDNAHNNPTMRVFAHLLWTKILSRRLRRPRQLSGSFNDISPLTSSQPNSSTSDPQLKRVMSMNSPAVNDNQWTFCDTPEDFRISRMSRFRWYLAYTLLRNPQLKKLRKNFLANTTKLISKTTSKVNLNTQ